ncbi:hypothetical protein G6F43_003832 [Rhizopus delemar]|nr:hypothetical protein G6F43_003832 [Rhizopus delemar]
MFKAMDVLSSDYQSVVPNTGTCLQLSFSGVLSRPPVDPIQRSLPQLQLSIFYVLEPFTNLLCACTNSEMTVHPYLTRRFLRLVRQTKTILSSFLVRPFIPVHTASLGPHLFTSDQCNVVDATPFIKDFNLTSSGSAEILSSKVHPNCCIAGINPPTQKYPLPHKKWTLFWKLPLISACRKVWYRLLYRKLPHRSLLNHLIPVNFPTVTCSICNSGTDTFEHFIYQCPKK